MPADRPADEGPKISVVTRTLGHEPFLRRCRERVTQAAGTCRIQWILVDDRIDPSDSIERLLRAEPSDARILTQVVASRSRHRAKAANAGLDAVEGDFLHFLDDDDTIEASFYGETVAFLREHENYGAVAVKAERVVEMAEADGSSYAEVARTLHYPEVKAVSLPAMAVHQALPPVSILFRTQAVRETGRFDEAFEVCEDYEFLLRFLCRHDMAMLPRVLARFHHRQSGLGNSASTLDYENTVAAFRNAMLRRDLDSGRVGLGWLLAIGELSTGSVKADRLLGRLHTMPGVRSLFSRLRRRP